MRNLPAYYDFAATTPVDPRVMEAMLPYFTEIFGNASSNHIYGKEALLAIEKSRHAVSDLISSDYKEIYFTSGATESINWAIKGFCELNAPDGCHIVTVETEHKAVLNTIDYLKNKGYEITYLKVNRDGLIDIGDFEKSLKDDTKLVSVMYVNNEIGVIQNIEEIGRICRLKSVTFFTDATQAVGKIPVDVSANKIDMLALSAHKFYGPKGIGALYIRKGIKISPLMHGGNQENGMRSGTYNTPLIVGLGKAAEIAQRELYERLEKTLIKKKAIVDLFKNRKYGFINFQNVETSPYILTFSTTEDDAQDLLIKVRGEFVASTGSACSSGLINESHVLKSVGINGSAIRISI
jgi:cysteine desulfurase